MSALDRPLASHERSVGTEIFLEQLQRIRRLAFEGFRRAVPLPLGEEGSESSHHQADADDQTVDGPAGKQHDCRLDKTWNDAATEDDKIAFTRKHVTELQASTTHKQIPG